jgi:hypothetical protein
MRRSKATHVFDHDPGLTSAGVPDWLLHLRAADDGFDAVVTRDWHQLDQPEELWVLANLRITVVSWRRPFNDPVAEWGHLLAYMPQLKRRIELRQPRVLLLPPPQLSKGNEVNPQEALGRYAAQQGRAVGEVLEEAGPQSATISTSPNVLNCTPGWNAFNGEQESSDGATGTCSVGLVPGVPSHRIWSGLTSVTCRGMTRPLPGQGMCRPAHAPALHSPRPGVLQGEVARRAPATPARSPASSPGTRSGAGTA